MTYRPLQARHERRRRRRAFTFVELMISIALVIVLMLGVNQIFGYTSQAVGAGEAVNAAVRDSRSLGETFESDFAQMVPNGNGPTDAPFMVLSSHNTYAFRDAADFAASTHRTGNVATDAASIDLNGDHVEGDPAVPGEQVNPTTLNDRDHRTDVFSFFARGNFRRQTGNAGTFVADMSSPEAWVWYGHLALPDNQYDPAQITANQYPGINAATASASVNPNNFYASQFVLGRVAVLLREPNLNNQILDDQGQPQMYVSGGLASADVTAPLKSLFRGAPVVAGGAASTAGETFPYVLSDARVDLAGTSIAGCQSAFTAFVAPFAAPAYGQGPSGVQTIRFNNDPGGTGWWDDLVSGDLTLAAGGGGGLTRFKCDPFVTKPMAAKDMAQASPYMLRGVSQFVVEYAGDYLRQENNPNAVANPANPSLGIPQAYSYGDVISSYVNPLLNVPVSATGVAAAGPGTDGEVDYVLIPPSDGSPAPRSQWRKQIRWYGFPRSTSNSAVINPAAGDVVPLAWHLKHAIVDQNGVAGGVSLDVSQSAGTTGTGPGCREMAFEKTNLPDAPNGNYAAVLAPGTSYQYTCAWGPNDPKPKLIRITVTLDDPSGRLANGQTYQYVFPVP